MDINIMELNLSKSFKRQSIVSPNKVEDQSNSTQKKVKVDNENIIKVELPMQNDQLQISDTHIEEKSLQKRIYVENLCDSVKTALNQSAIHFNHNSTLGKLITENILQGNTVEDILSDNMEETIQKKGVKKESGYPVTIKFKDGSVALALINKKTKKKKNDKDDYEVHGQSINNRMIRNIITSQNVSLVKKEGKFDSNPDYIKKNRDIIKNYFGKVYLKKLDKIDKEEIEYKQLKDLAQERQEKILSNILKLKEKGHTDKSPEIKIQMQLLGNEKNQEIGNGIKLLKCQEKRSQIFQKLQRIQEENEYYSDLLCSGLNNNSITFEEGSRLNKSLKGQKVKNVQFLSSYYHRKSNFLHHDSKNEKQGCPVLITLENGKSVKVLMNIKDEKSFEIY